MRNLLAISVILAALAACGEDPPMGVIGCSCRIEAEARCTGLESAKGSEDPLRQVCDNTLAAGCTAGGGVYSRILPCPSEGRFATCVEPPETSDIVRVEVWESSGWDPGDTETIESACAAVDGELYFE